MTVSGWALSAFLTYLLLIVGIGLWAARFSSLGISEFFVAGRRMNRFVVAVSAVASGRSAWLMLGMTGMAYTMGASALWAAVGYTTVECLLFLFFAPRIRRFAGAYDCITLPDVFARRFNDDDGRLRMALAAIFTFFLVAYVSAQFVGGGKAISTSFQISPTVGILLTAGFVLTYTVLGGFLAVSVTDALQGILMVLTLLGLPILVALELGGPGAVLGELRAFDPGMVDPLALSIGALVGFVGIGLAAPGNPHIVIRYISIDDPAQFRYVAVVGTAWNALMALGAILIGLVGRVYFPELDSLPQADPENLLPVLAAAFLPAAVFGIVVAAIFAAIMSTADSQLLVMAS
ncbi:MAG: sodium/proline symporter, partial [Gemmatimonadota bacterium]